MFSRRAADISGEPWFNQNELPSDVQDQVKKNKLLRIKKDLRGYVVLVNFWDYSCRDCIDALPHLKVWWERYKQFNFILLGVHTPEFAYEGDGDKVESAMLRFRLSYPVVSDAEYETWERYRCHKWPRNVLADHKGKKVFDHSGAVDYGNLEVAIQEQLKIIHPDASFVDSIKPAN